MRNNYIFLLLTALLWGFGTRPTVAQQSPRNPAGGVYVDKQGVLRWRNGRREVALFGVNYTTPFAYSYRAHQYVGAAHEQAIAQDVYHLARLGLDAFRVHVWDIEISDTLGNLQENDHLRLLDNLISQLKQRNIKVVLTPIAYWGNGYPETGVTGPGFSGIYSKQQAYVNPRAIKAQANYLNQFLNHRNPYTKLLNKDDPDIIAFEVCNEPSYQQPEAPVQAFANTMVSAIKNTGCAKPIFYNLAENPSVANAILGANVDGLTFQWYPAGLVSGHTMRGNFLPYVDRYPIPYQDDTRFIKRAKIVYEFESADILQPIMYPFMARSFRTAGFQWATQFAYDPMALAYANTEYQTHYLNLAYTPAKAISLLIASKVFHTIGRHQAFPGYPADSVFGAFHVSYRQQLSEMNTKTEFYYTSATNTNPIHQSDLQHVAGTGSSPVVQYGGTGAYFLDKLAPGVWRLEVMPDAVPLRDPFETPSLKKTVTQIIWNTQDIQLSLSSLGKDFTFKGLNQGNDYQGQARDGRMAVKPGVYIVAGKGRPTAAWRAESVLGNIRLGEFAAPVPTALPPQVAHTPLQQVTAGKPFTVSAMVTGADDSVLLVVQHYYGRTVVLPMRRLSPTTVEATVPAALTYAGLVRYWIVLKNKQLLTFPGGFPGSPRDWDYSHTEHWEVPTVAPSTPLVLFDAGRDKDQVEAKGVDSRNWIDYVTSTPTGALALRMRPAATAATSTAGPAVCLRVYFGQKLAGRTTDLSAFKEVVVRVRAPKPTGKVKIVLVTKDAAAYSATLSVPSDWQEVHIPLTAFQPDNLLLSPRPYPGFLPLEFKTANPQSFCLADAEVLQLVLDHGPTPDATLDLESVQIQ